MDEEFEDRDWADDGADADSEPEDSAPQEDPQQVIKDCMQLFASPDYIMEPGIFATLKRYFSVRQLQFGIVDHYLPVDLFVGTFVNASRSSLHKCVVRR